MGNESEPIDPEAFLSAYDLATPIVVGELRLTLGAALAMERDYCKPENEADTKDPQKRIEWLANKLAAGGSLLPEHKRLLTPQE